MTTDMNPKPNMSSTPAIPSSATRTPVSSQSNGQRNRAQFKGKSNENRAQADNRRGAGRNHNRKKRGAGNSKSGPGLSSLRTPVNQYLSVCCGLAARKPQTGRKDMVQDPDSKKLKETPKGLGKWHCSQCGKSCKVNVTKPATASVTAVAITTAIVEVTSEALPV